MAQNLDPEAAEEPLKTLLEQIAQASVDQMRKLADHQEARARRQGAVADRLAAKLGDQDKRVQALRRSGEAGRRLAADLGRAISRAEAARGGRPGSLLFSGRVTDAAGVPVAGATVRLSDRTGTLRIPGSAATDELGEFSLAIPPDAVDRTATDLSLVVEDAEARIAGMSPGPLRVEPDVWQRVELTAATPPRPADAGGGRRRGSDRRRTPRSSGG